MRFHVAGSPLGDAEYEHAVLDEEGKVVAVFHKSEERLARRAALLLSQALEAPRVVDSTKAGPRTSKARTPRQEPRQAPSSDTAPVDEEREEYEAGGALVTVWPSRLVYLRFPDRPDDETLVELRQASFRWMGVRRGWRGRLEDLPLTYERVPC